MNITIYALNNWLLYFIYLHKGFISESSMWESYPGALGAERKKEEGQRSMSKVKIKTKGQAAPLADSLNNWGK